MLEVVRTTIGSLPVWQIPSWLSLGISHGFLERDLDFRFPKKAWPELKRHLNKGDLNLSILDQVHGVELVDFDLFNEQTKQADGWIGSIDVLQKKKMAIGIKTADCTPVLAVGKNKGLVMALHCGWRGAYGGLLGIGIKQMLNKGESVDSIEIAFGPAAQIACYEVGLDLASKFENKLRSLLNAINQPLVTRVESGKYYLSVSSYLELEAISFGISKENVVVSEECTILEKNFFSYRREKDDSGRLLSFFCA